LAIRTVDAELTAVPLLRDFMGLNRVARLDRTHPLRAMRFLSRPDEMKSVSDVASLWGLESVARPIVRYLIEQGHDDRLRHDLRNANDCRDLLFEASAVSVLFEPFVEAISWRRYEVAASDIATLGPQMQVECTQMEDDDFDGMIKRAEEKLRQKRQGEGAYLVVVGMGTARRLHIMNDVTDVRRRRLDDWMGRHPEASAFHLVAPRDLDESDRVTESNDGYILQAVRFFGVTVRNVRAADPLAVGFEDNWRLA
jgi:hypothetical protein